ncbi:MAG: hypothetical protein AAB527_02995 [Patescibacteria group bacterium]
MAQFREFFYTLYQTALIPVFKILAKLWWLWLFIFAFILAKNLWQFYMAAIAKKKDRWILLEILIPREIKKSPKAMEQILSEIYSLGNKAENFIEKYWEGEVPYWWSLEIASLGGEIHFYIRTSAKYKNIIESNIYTNYKDAEVIETADYIERLPSKTTDLYKAGLDLFGLELALGRSAHYPIKTYADFETIEEEERLDPIGNLIEVLSKIKKEEQLWLQLLVRPVDASNPVWKESGIRLIKELKEKAVTKVKINEEDSVTVGRSPGEEEVIKKIEQKLAKSQFETIIRYIYFAPRAIFNRQLPYRGVRGAFAQYSTQNMNYFVPNIKTRTMVWWIRFPFFFPKKREEAKKQRLFKNYRERRMPEEMKIGSIINSQFFYFDNKSKITHFSTEELATLYHLPSFPVLTAPFIKRVEAKRMGPPAGLQIFGEEEDVPGLKISEEKEEKKK